ncbi:hypothetical protein M3Y94_01134600 [Aphelenchoides besseyi]|nr:hypothetical protein M3Y94_01134600 [Aphelenchoides besseyi]KAI6218243.1 hypothetical protein M3Y95_01169500 [Aphelenchoides besseyi]
MTHGVDEPLRATYNPQRPRWVGWYTGREYKGRLNWWNELGWCDSLTAQKKLAFVRSDVRENDPEWFDEKVPDGTSLAGAFGKDTRYHGNTTMKGDQPGDLFEFKKKVMQSSVQYKQIAEKFDLSPEHPGIAVSPTMSSLQYTPWRNLGVGSVFPSQSIHQWGPRFFNKPMNEGCVEKGLTLAKYVAMFNVVTTYAQFQSEPSKDLKQFRIGELTRRYLRSLPYPATVAFGYGVSICTSATIRNKDDIYNPIYAGVCSGILITKFRNITTGVSYGLVLIILGITWHYQRLTRFGIQGPVQNPMISSYWTGPQAYKMLDFGHAEVPKDVY